MRWSALLISALKGQVALERTLRHLDPKVVDHSKHKREAASYRERDGHTGDRSGSAEADIRKIEYHTSYNDAENGG